MRTSCNGTWSLKLLANLLLLFALFQHSHSASAQNYPDPAKYCYANYTWYCYDTLPLAEAALRASGGAEHPEYALLEQTSAEISYVHERPDIAYTYFLPLRPPATWASIYYFGSNDCPTAGCSSEEQVAQLLWTKSVAANQGCVVSPYTIEGSYDEPVTAFGLGGLQDSPIATAAWYGKTVKWTVDCGTVLQHEYPVSKSRSYTCEQGYAKVGPSHTRESTGALNQVAVDTWNSGNLCRPLDSTAKQIYTGIQQVGSCPPNSHPCVPGTGEKVRREMGVEFAGQMLFFNYHSLAQLRSRHLPGGWRHSFEERLVPNYDASTVGYVDAQGEYDEFKFSSNIQVSNQATGKPGRVLKRVIPIMGNPPTSYQLINSAGEVREFSPMGHLLSISNDSHPEADLYFTYVDSGKRLVSVADAKGRMLTFNYTGDRLTSISLPDGQDIAIGWSGNQLVTLSHAGFTRTYHYKPGTSLLEQIDGEDTAIYAQFAYDTAGRVVSSQLAGPSGPVERTTLTYTSPSQVSVTIDGQGQTDFVFGTGTFRPITQITDAAGVRSFQNGSYGYPNYQVSRTGVTTDIVRTYGMLMSTTVAGSTTLAQRKTVDYNYNTFRPLARTSWRKSGNTYIAARRTNYVYDGSGAEIAYCEVNPTVTAANNYDCASSSAPPTGVRKTIYTRCSASEVSMSLCPIVGQLRAIDGPGTGPQADITQLSYYLTDDPACASSPTLCPHRKGDLWKLTNAAGQVTEYLKYDGAGRVLSIKDANGVITEYEYDTRGMLVATKVRGANDTTEADDAITRNEYWPTGQVKRATQSDGSYIDFMYDSAHRLTDVLDNAGNRIHYTLDNASNRIGEEIRDNAGALKRKLSRVYSTRGHLQAQLDAQSNTTSFTYDDEGNTNTVTDALGTVTDENYDVLNRLSRILQDVGGISAETSFAYDALNNLVRLTDPKGLVTYYTYNGLNELTQLSSPDTGPTSYSYDSSGNQTSSTDARGVTTSYSYDALNRMTGKSYPNSSLNVTRVYDVVQPACVAGETFAVGHLTRLNDASGSTQYCFNRFGQLVRKVQTSNGISLVLRYVWSPAGQLIAMVYPDGTEVDYSHDTRGRIAGVGVTRPGQTRQVVLSQASYLPFGRVASWTFGNGRSMVRNVDQNYRPISIEDSDTGGLSLGFGYDAVGNLTKMGSALGVVSPDIVFGYDALGRLTRTEDGPSHAVIDGYTYDGTGNRLSHTTAAGISAYTYSSYSHQLDIVGSSARSYDNVGNTIAIGSSRQFVYDDSGRMSQAKLSGAVAMNYVYNANGAQVRRHLGTTNTYSLYDESGYWLGDYDNAGVPLQQAIWMDSLPVGLLANGGQLHYIEPDHLGAPRVVIEVARNVAVWKWDMKGEIFGGSAPEQDVDGNSTAMIINMRAPGQRYDSVSGLNYNYYRDYDPTTGRYVQSDPIGLMAGVSTYSYAMSSPLIWSDLFGLLIWDLKPTIWDYVMKAGMPSRTTPWAEPKEFTKDTLGRTTMDWSVSAQCSCTEGIFTVDQFAVSLIPTVKMLQRYDTPDLRRSTRSDEQQHVNDITKWANGTGKSAAQRFEDEYSYQYLTDSACKQGAPSAMEGHLEASIKPTVHASWLKYDYSKQHTTHVPE